MKLLIPLITLLMVGGCLSNTSNLDVEPSFNNAIALNGFWDGQFNQAGAVRFLLYEGEIFGTDGTSGYRGTVSYSESDQNVSMNMRVLGLTTNELSGDYIVAGGDSTLRSFDGLLITQPSAMNSIVGNYTQPSEGGGLSLDTDGTWQNGSALWQLVGTWRAGSYKLSIGQSGDHNEFFGEGPSGCSFSGNIFLLNDRYPLFELQMYSRSNCSGFNLEPGQTGRGFTAVTADSELEIYTTLNDELLIMRFTK